ncbi:flagellar biosynthesis protein FlhA [Salmonella enterica subsp. enterica]|uniref:Flagellar biosynthesis protein FlhA n=1 Tax=Salmonella enterica I TaxID=59201 RepID=A0A379WSH9_SALET|nr:flagellar biosynthesis protein FlhA [Salmonella enterica subsp. enterica]
MANLVAMLRLPSNLKSTQWQILAGADPHSADFVDDGAAATCFYPRLIIYL